MNYCGKHCERKCKIDDKTGLAYNKIASLIISSLNYART